MDISGSEPSPRGAGVVFGPDVVRKFLTQVGVKTLVRSHELTNMTGFERQNCGNLD